MPFLEDINNGKYNIVLFNIIFIYFILIAYLFHNQNCMKENMADVPVDIKEAIKQVYSADVEAIRNLSNVATQLQAGGLTIPGNLTVTGDVTVGSNLNVGIKDKTDGTITVIDKSGNPGKSNLIIRGTIVAWTGAAAPPGWALCDGANGTPDLRGRFIRMASASLDNEAGAAAGWAPYIVGRKSNAGGVDASVIGNSRTDSSTWIYKMNIGEFGGTDHQVLHLNEMPAHAHNVNDWDDAGTSNSARGNVYHRGAWYSREQDQNGNQENRNALFDSTSAAAGASWGHNNMPPYFVLAYIMKL